jgi:hemerythrin
MFEWSNKYKTGIDTVDHEHQTLFDMFNKVSMDIASGQRTKEELAAAINDLIDYSRQHFEDEEKIMAQYAVDERHTKRQKMEHNAFRYDVAKLQKWTIDDKMTERFERLVTFIASWLVFHTLRVDQELGIQIREIQAGKTPAEAYDIAVAAQPHTAFHRQIIEALIHLWSNAADRVTHLEKTLASLGHPVD